MIISDTDQEIVTNILVKKITKTRKKKYSTAREDVIVKKVFRAVKEYLDVKMEELTNYKKVLS